MLVISDQEDFFGVMINEDFALYLSGIGEVSVCHLAEVESLLNRMTLSKVLNQSDLAGFRAHCRAV